MAFRFGAALTLGILGVFATVTLVAQNPMRPGRWEITMQMQMPNVPVQMPEIKTTQCVTPEEIENPTRSVPGAPPAQGGDEPACKVSDYKISGNTVSWKMSCEAPQEMTGQGEMTFNGDSYAGAMTMTTPQGQMSMKMAGKRLGECTP